MPKISVIVPVYKVEAYIHRCVDSILAQTFTDFELILVDDGSPDNCGKICDEYAEKDTRIIVIHQKNGGLSAARNAGIDWIFANSNSEWISFIDSDDWIDCDYLSLLYNCVKKTNTDISICSYKEVDSGQTIFLDKNNLQFSKYEPEKFYCDNLINATIACGKLYKKDLFRKIRYPAGRIHEDEFVTYKLLFRCNTISFINLPLYFYFINSAGITKSTWTPKRLDKLAALKEQEHFFRKNNFQNAWQKCITQYRWDITDSFIELDKAEISNKSKYKRYIKKYLRYVLRYDKQHLTMRTRPDLFKQAYPFFTECYWVIKGIKNKFKR